jgi:hypothetical protein
LILGDRYLSREKRIIHGFNRHHWGTVSAIMRTSKKLRRKSFLAIDEAGTIKV